MSSELPPDFATRLAIDSPDAIIFADAEGIIRFWNTAATRIFGFAESEAIGARLDLIIPERLRGRHWEGYDKVMAGAESRYAEGALLAVPAMRKDGSQLSVEFTILPLRDAAGRLLGIAAYLRDATARFAEMRALRRELAALKAG
ncbi:MAG TPA: PAS domain S-box protein [Stellaceae bacterium]|nr:PAS domain S-box protein [Stellaceae bacterium]